MITSCGIVYLTDTGEIKGVYESLAIAETHVGAGETALEVRSVSDELQPGWYYVDSTLHESRPIQEE